MAERRDEPVTGEVIEDGSIRAYSWEWNDIGSPAGRNRSRLPWFGIFLVVFGALLLLRLWFPALETAGSLLFLAVGVAFLVSWLANRGMGSLYLGSIIVALAAPDLLIAAGAPDQSGLGTLCLGVAFLFIALVRGISGGGVGWQAGLGAILALIGLTSYAVPGFGDLFWPLILLGLGVFVLVRASAARR
jgi:hypothetical protein